jgi:hypothetical protein
MPSTIEPDDIRIEPMIGSFALDVREGFRRARDAFEDLGYGSGLTIESLARQRGIDLKYVEAPYGLTQVEAATDITQLYNDLTLQSSLFGAPIRLRGKVYKHTGTLRYLTNNNVSGVGGGTYAHGEVKQDMQGTILLACGAFTDSYQAVGVTDCRLSGGWRENPDSATLGYTHYKLNSYYNEDANPTTGAAATPLNFSVAHYFAPGVRNCVLRDLRIMLSFNGIAGYDNATPTLADDVDVGVMLDNSERNIFDNVMFSGYWRKDAVLGLANVCGNRDGLGFGIEHNVFRDCKFSGYNNLSMRGMDLWRVVGVGSTYIDLPWAANHPFDLTLLTGRVRRAIGTETTYSLTGTSVVGGNLRLTGVSPSPTGATNLLVGQTITPGVQGLSMGEIYADHCTFAGLDHKAKIVATDSRLGYNAPSCAISGGGWRMRGFSAPGCKISSLDCVAYHFTNLQQTWLGPKFEIEGGEGFNGATALGRGLRCIATPNSGAADIPYPAGNTFALFVDDIPRPISNTADFRPMVVAGPARFPTASALNTPNRGVVRSIVENMDSGSVIHKAPLNGRVGLADKDDNWKFHYYDTTSVLSADAPIRMNANQFQRSGGVSWLRHTGGNTFYVEGQDFTIFIDALANQFFRVCPEDISPITTGQIDLGRNGGQFKDGYFSGKLNAPQIGRTTTTDNVAFLNPSKLLGTTFATLSTTYAPALWAECTVRVTDRGQRLVTSDGTNWRDQAGNILT